MSTNYGPYQGKIGYGISYSTENKYADEGYEWKLLTEKIEYNRPSSDTGTDLGENCLLQHTLQNIINHDSGTQVLQKRNTTALPSETHSYHMVGKRDSSLPTLLEEWVGLLPITDGEVKTLKDCNFTYNDHNDKIVDISFNWE